MSPWIWKTGAALWLAGAANANAQHPDGPESESRASRGSFSRPSQSPLNSLPRSLPNSAQTERSVTRVEADEPEGLQIRHLFDIAEDCRRKGDLAKARTCYDELRRTAPTSRHGRLAASRLNELTPPAVAELSEEQEPPVRQTYRVPGEPRREPGDDDARRREMLRDTEPLDVAPSRADEEPTAFETIQFNGPLPDSGKATAQVYVGSWETTFLKSGKSILTTEA